VSQVLVQCVIKLDSVGSREQFECTLVASHAAPLWVTVSMPAGQTDRRTNRRKDALR